MYFFSDKAFKGKLNIYRIERVDLHELLPVSVVSDILPCASHPAVDLIKDNLGEVESSWDFLEGMQVLEEQNVSYCVKYFVVCQCSATMVEFLRGLHLAQKTAQLRA